MLQRGGARRRRSQEHCAIDRAEKHGLLKADHRASWGRGHLSYVRPHCNQYLLEDYIWWVSSGLGRKQQCNWWWCGMPWPVRLGESEQNLCHTGLYGIVDKQKFSVALHGACDHLVNAVNLLANQHQDGDRLLKVLVEGLQERRRWKMMEKLRKFITMDNHNAVRKEDLKKTQGVAPIGQTF